MKGFCDARTRKGGSCRRRPCDGRTRCHLHGGRSRAWFAHPNFKHGRYSKYSLAGYEWRRQRQAVAFHRDVNRALARLPGDGVSLAQMLAVMRGVRAYHRRRGWFVKLLSQSARGPARPLGLLRVGCACRAGSPRRRGAPGVRYV
ncbi:MAG: HGGxSTG domain-containing protein [Pyrinomonadaceae bacterium]